MEHKFSVGVKEKVHEHSYPYCWLALLKTDMKHTNFSSAMSFYTLHWSLCQSHTWCEDYHATDITMHS